MIEIMMKLKKQWIFLVTKLLFWFILDSNNAITSVVLFEGAASL